MHRPLLKPALTCTAVLLATACGSSTESQGNHVAHLEAASVDMAQPARGLSYDALSAGMRNVGSELAGKVPTGNGNLVLSPASLGIAFAMLREGASGQTAQEIDRVLQLPANRQAAYNGLIHALADPSAGNVLAVNDGLFIDPSLTVERSYLDAIKKWYGAGVEQVEFPNPALSVINGWVKDKTRGRIPRLLPQLDPTSVFALVNTVYLNAKWQTPFSADKTSPAAFTVSPGNAVTVQTMHMTSELDYASGPGWQAMRLPYQGNQLSMWVLLPSDQAGTGGQGGHANPLSLLSAATLARAGQGFAKHSVELSLPRWDTNTAGNITAVLKQLGMRHTFDGAGNFDALTKDGRFAVTDVVQQANITVGEKGTEAAAATAIIGRLSAVAPPADLVRFDANHPFAFAVMHDRTGVPLFEGVVGNPS
ncbi:MAG: serpin family protein [Nocardioidaceae bacterium]